MLIIYLHQYFKFPDEQGGTRSYDLATQFVSRGYDVVVLSATSNPKFRDKKGWFVVNRDGLKVNYIYIPYANDFSYFKRIVVFFKFLVLSTIRLAKMQCNLVLATSTPLTIGVPALIKRFLDRTPYIFEVRDVWPEAVIAIGAIENRFLQKVLYFIEKVIYRNAASVVPLSEDMKASIIRRYPNIDNKIHHVIPNISEVNRFQNNRMDRGFCNGQLGFSPRFTVLYAGTFGRVNGLHNVVKLASILRDIDPGICFILLGSGAFKNAIEEQATNAGVLGINLFIFDPVSKDELPHWYGSVSMGASFVINVKELWANSANKFFDTLAAGKPVLINHEGWQADVIRTHNVGFVLPVNIDSESAKVFSDYTKDAKLHLEQRKNALTLAREKFSLQVATEKYVQVFSKVSDV